jgi:hypothetical protein
MVNTAGDGGPTTPPATPRNLNNVLILTLAWKGRVPAPRHPAFVVHDILPEPNWPVGRKGLLLDRLWTHLSKDDSDGILLCDADVAIDEGDMIAMTNAACTEPDAVHTAPVKLWPKATGLPVWIWGHRKLLPPLSNEETLYAWQQDIEDPEMFSFCFTYLPRRLVEGAVKSGLKRWTYPTVDQKMSETARDMGIPIRVVRNGCHPRHLHY